MHGRMEANGESFALFIGSSCAMGVTPNAVSLRFFNRKWTQIDADENPRISLFICVHPRPSAVQFFALHV
jgi:hypothetical protein